MHNNDPFLETLQRNLDDWAEDVAECRVVLLVGSKTRIQHPADQYSGLVLLLFVTDPSTGQQYMLRVPPTITTCR